MAPGLSTSANPAPDHGGALVFIGFMGSGKSTAARNAAAHSGRVALDSDRLLEESFGHTIEEHFERHGEAAFREAEQRVVCELLARAGRGDAVALGGGSVASERVRDALAAHTVVLLEIDAESAWERASGRNRPLARDPDAFAQLHAQRTALYESVADAILPARRESVIAALAALERLARAPAGTRMLWAPAADPAHEYPVHIGRGLLRAPPWPIESDSRRLAVSDANVWPLHGGARLPTCEPLPLLTPGESSKTIVAAERLWAELAERGVTRADHLVALGGGVVGDLTGFVAATYQRGIPVVQVPTSLVGQVDSAYGGKTGVDLPRAKNYVGAYHQPAAVIADTATLDTLPQAEVAAGYAEVLKTALIAGGELWGRVAHGAAGTEQEVVLACARTKLEIVAQDERDAGRRQVLNLGHTVAHAIEAVTAYQRYRHGEAVALGLLAALELSGVVELRAQVAEMLAAAGLPTRLDDRVDAAGVVAATRLDKKRIGTSVPFVLVASPGDVRTGQEVAEADLIAAVAGLQRGG